MIDQPTLFEMPIGTPVVSHRPEWFVFGKWTPAIHKQRVMRGKHPMGNELGGEATRCGTCRFASANEHGRRYWKCEKNRPWTSGAATDIKLKWRGCALWEGS